MCSRWRTASSIGAGSLRTWTEAPKCCRRESSARLGSFCAGARRVAWCAVHRHRRSSRGATLTAWLQELRLTALQAEGEGLLQGEDCERHVPRLSALVIEYPLQERLWEQLVISLTRSGRRAEALVAFGQARDALRRGLGVEPGSRLTAAYRVARRRVVRQTPTRTGTGAAQDPIVAATRDGTLRPGRPRLCQGPSTHGEAELASRTRVNLQPSSTHAGRHGVLLPHWRRDQCGGRPSHRSHPHREDDGGDGVCPAWRGSLPASTSSIPRRGLLLSVSVRDCGQADSLRSPPGGTAWSPLRRQLGRCLGGLGSSPCCRRRRGRSTAAAPVLPGVTCRWSSAHG
jgi:hypothetical protein